MLCLLYSMCLCTVYYDTVTELGDCDIVTRGGGGVGVDTSDHGLPAAAWPNGKRVPPHRHTLQRIGEPQGILWFLSSSGFPTLFFSKIFRPSLPKIPPLRNKFGHFT
jgi:hypothetical protein